MELITQVVSLEPAKRLKELGVKQESYFEWIWNHGEEYIHKRITAIRATVEDAPVKVYAAFTVAELGEMLLAEEYNSPWFDIDEKCWKWDDYIGYPVVKKVRTLQADTEANARAKMLIYLIENKLIRP